jgi:hypothetical protein
VGQLFARLLQRTRSAVSAGFSETRSAGPEAKANSRPRNTL